jgi:hypothetical protein
MNRIGRLQQICFPKINSTGVVRQSFIGVNALDPPLSVTDTIAFG